MEESGGGGGAVALGVGVTSEVGRVVGGHVVSGVLWDGGEGSGG